MGFVKLYHVYTCRIYFIVISRNFIGSIKLAKLKEKKKNDTYSLAKQPLSMYPREMTAQEYPEIQTRKSIVRLLTEKQNKQAKN